MKNNEVEEAYDFYLMMMMRICDEEISMMIYLAR